MPTRRKKILDALTKFSRVDVRYFGKGAAWLSSSQAIISLLTIASAVAFANLLPQEIFGHYRYILSIFALLELTTLSGMNVSLVRAASRGFERTFTAIFKRKVLGGLLGSVGAIIGATYYFIYNNHILGTALIICALFIPLGEPLKLYGAILHARRNYKMLSIRLVVIQAISVSSLVITMLLSDSLYLLLIAYFLPVTLCHAFVFFYTLRTEPLTGTVDSNALQYGYHMSFLKGFVSASGHIQNLFLFHFLGPAATALFYFAQAPIEQMRALVGQIETLLFPKVAQNNWEVGSLRFFFWKISPFLVVLSIGTLLYILFAPLLFKILFPSYEEAVLFSQLYAPTIIFTALNTVLFTIVKSKGLVKTQYLISGIDAVLVIILCIPAIAYFGIFGLIGAILIAKLVQAFLLLYRLFIYPQRGHTV
jgi:O-antigen/teichoic acid export membrane protein